MSAPLTGDELLTALERGEVRVAEPDGAGGWTVHAWVKEEILRLFRESPMEQMGEYRDKRAFPLRTFGEEEGVRLVPRGSGVRRGAHVAPGVICMPPMYVNVGAYVGAGTMVDSHALVGSCAQIGERVHLSAGCQVGGVLEPPGARPVIVEDGAFLGALSGVFEGVRIGAGAVVAGGVVLTASTPVFDLVNERELRGTADAPLEIPERAVLLPGTRPARGEYARELGLGVSCALVVKYRDERTDAATSLEDALR